MMEELPNETRIYEISPAFANSKKLPCYFAARPIIQTQKAAYLVGRGTTRTTQIGVCMSCGRKLTHPVSVELGIGPECGKHFWNWDLIGGYSKENLERLKSKVQEIKVDGWFPKSIIKELWETDDHVNVPKDHPMLNNKKKEQPAKKAVQVKYQQSGKAAIKITFPFDREVLEQVKTLPGRRFHNEGKVKYWTCPLSIDAVEQLQEWGFELDQNLQDYLNRAKMNVNEVQEIEVPGLHGELMPFQRQGVSFIEAKDGRALIGDEMGLGKTIQALAYLQLHPEKRPAVVVCPASLKLNWKQECEKWMDRPNIQLLQGKKADIPIVGDILIINYDILSSWVDVLKKIQPQVLITDECHLFKNNQAQRTKVVKKLGKDIPHVIALSGTPIVNRPIEGFNAINLIDSGIFPSFWKYAQTYCNAKHNGFGWDFSGASNTEELHEKLTNTVMIRRKKEDVLKDLPDKVYSFLPMELNNQREYNKAEADFITWIKEQKGEKAAKKAKNAEALSRINGLKQLAAKGKMKQSIEWIRNHIDSNGKLVVFANHKFVIDQLMQEFEDVAVKVDGSVSNENRNQAVEQFQNDDEVRLFVGNIKAAGVGLTLTAASSVAFLELPWTPGDLTQAEDRCHRIGQKDSVNIYYLLASGTIEEEIASLIDKKRKVLDQVLDGKETEQESLLSELMESYNQ